MYLPSICLDHPIAGSSQSNPISMSSQGRLSWPTNSPSLLCHPIILSWLLTEGAQNMPAQNMPLWHKDYFELITLKKQKAQETFWQLNRSYPVWGTFPRTRQISIVSPSPYQKERGDTKSQETLHTGEGTYLNLHNNLTLVPWDFKNNIPPLAPPPQNIFLMSSAKYDI